VLIWAFQGYVDWIAGAAGGEYYGEGNYASWATVKATAEANWAPTTTGNIPFAATAGKHIYSPSETFQAKGGRSKLKAKLYEPIGTGISRAIDWHLYSEAADFGWAYAVQNFDANGAVDANGDPLTEDAWHRWRTEDPAPDVAQPESADYLSSNFDFPNWCDEPAFQVTRGFQAAYAWALIRWDVSGGFSYT